MAQKTNLNVFPYYDDYDPTKDFYKILFRPGYSVQARELTQLQDILQNQISNLGAGMFQDGEMVVPGAYSYVNNATYVKISRITAGVTVSEYVGYTLTGETSGVKAKVLLALDSTETDSIVFFVQFISSGSNNEDSRFQEGETLLSDHPNNYTAVVGISTVSSPTTISSTFYDNSGNIISSTNIECLAQGNGSYFTIDAGIYFIRGFMTRVNKETIVLSKFSDKPTCKIGFNVFENFVTPEQDNSLLDNAQGYSNFTAPGAHRFQIKTTLTFLPIDEVDENFVEIARVVNGVLQRKKQKNTSNFLWEALARRTYDESGNYIVAPFSIDLKEWINTNNQDGLFSLGSDGKFGQGDAPTNLSNSTQDTNGTIEFDENGKVVFNYGVITDRLTAEEADSKFVISIGAGKAYVSGYELESVTTDFIVGDKARTTQFREKVRNSITEGQHTYVSNTYGSPDIQNVTTGGTAFAYKNLLMYKTFTDGFAGLTDKNIGNATQTTYHLVTTNTTTYQVGDSLGTGYVVYFSSFTGGSNIVLTGTSDYAVGDSIGNGVINTVFKHTPVPIGLTRPRFYKASNLILDGDQKANSSSEFKLGIQSSSFFVHLSVRNSNTTPLAGKVVVGSKSRARGVIETGSTVNTLILSNVDGIFEPGENIVSRDNTFSCSLKRKYEIDELVVTNFSSNPTSSITIKYVGQELVLNNSTDYNKTTNGSRFTLSLTETGRNKIYNFYGLGTSGYVEITKFDSTSGNFGYGVILQNHQRTFSFNNVKSVYSTSDSNNKFSADLSYLNILKTASKTITNGANYVGVVGNRYLECQDIGQDPSVQVSYGDVITVTDEGGVIRRFVVHFATAPVGQSTVRQNGRIYLTTALPSNITGNPVTQFQSKTNNSDRNTLIYKLPTNTTSTIESNPEATNINYVITRQFMGTLTSGTTITFTSTSSNETFLRDTDQYVFTFADTTSNSNVGKYVRLRQSDVSFADGDKKITITLPFNAGGNYKVKLIVPVSVTNGRAKRKIRKTSIDFNEPDYTQHKAYINTGYDKEEISLNVVDAIRVRSIYAATTPTGNPTDLNSRTNVTDRYYLKTGQTDTYYSISTIVLKKGSKPADGPLYVDFDYFEHSEDGDFFSVDSYTDELGVNYAEIPSFTSEVIGTVELRDCIDFRPSVDPNLSVVPIYDGLGEINSLNFSGPDANPSRVPVEFTTFDCDIQSYLPRRDSIFLTPIGDFVLVKGTASENPQFPTDLSGSMRLFDLDIPAYTFSAKDIIVKTYNYQRYTMSDIQSIDKRVKRLEEVISLSLLEQRTLSSQVKDAVTGLDRFKNGIIVDDFSDHLTGAMGDPEYKCAVDKQNTHLRSPFHNQQVTLTEATNSDLIRLSNGYVKTGDFIHLPYVNVELASNKFVTGSINIQPYSVFTYTGELYLNPEIDEWNDIETLPEIRVTDNGSLNSIYSLTGNPYLYGTLWNSWNTYWTGVPQAQIVETSSVPGYENYNSQRLANQLVANYNYGYRYGYYYGYPYYYYNYYYGYQYYGYPYYYNYYYYGYPYYYNYGYRNGRFTGDGVETVDYAPYFGGYVYNKYSTVTKDTNLGSRVVDVSLATYMRARAVQFTGTGLKPNTRYYAFFDGQDVNSWISPDEPKLIKETGEYAFSFEAGNNQKGFGQPIISDSFGIIQGIFVVPNGNPPKPYVNQSQLTTTVNGVVTSSGVVVRQDSVQSINGVNWYNQVASMNVKKIVYYNPLQFPITPQEIENDPNFDSSEVPASRQFKVGDRVLRFTSSINDSRRERELEAYAEKTYTANGLIQTKQDAILSTRVPRLTQRYVSSTGTATVIYEGRSAYAVCSFFDPVAQTFTIDETDNPKGVYVTGLDIFFETKSNVHAVEVYMTSTEGGRPTETKIPGTSVYKLPDTYLRVKCNLATGINTENFVSGTTVVGVTSGAKGTLKSTIKFESSAVNAVENTNNKVYTVVLSNYDGEFIPGEQLRFSRVTPVTSTFTIVTDSYKVSEVEITNFGSGYLSLDDVSNSSQYVSVQFSVPELPGGVQATGYAKVSNGRLYDVVITNPGSGYTSTPSVTFVGGGASITALGRVLTSLTDKAVSMGVATSSGGTVPTRFNFDGPVYLESGKTYAFVVYCPSSLDYKIFVSRLGDKRLLSDGTKGTELVNKQPVLGSLFKSQNGSLWTEDQNEDITFVLYKARFDTSKVATVEFNNVSIPTIKLTGDPISTNSDVGSGNFFGGNPSIIRIRCNQPHGLLKGDLVEIDGITSSTDDQTIGGIPVAKINRQHLVLHSDFYSFDINVGFNATSSVTGGGIDGSISCNLPYEVFQPQVSYLNYQETNVQMELLSARGGSIDDGYTSDSYTLDSPVPVYANQDYYFRSPRLVASNNNETLNSGPTQLNGNKSLRLRITFSSINPDLSPVIDTQRTNAILIRSLIDDPDMNDDRFGPTRTLLTLDNNVSLSVGDWLYGVLDGTSLNGSISKVVSYNSDTKEILVEKIDSGDIVPETGSSVFSVKSTQNTKTSSSVAVGDTVINVTAPHNLIANDYVKIDNEYMRVTTTTSTSITVVRGLLGSTAATHNTNVNVFKLNLIGSVFTNEVALITSHVKTGSSLYVPETDSNLGSSFAKFKSRTFTLENPSDQINLSISALLFEINSLKCYYKIRSENDSKNLNEIPWIPFNGTGYADNAEKARIAELDDINPNTIPKNLFFDYKFTATGLTPFTSFEVKFVFNTTNPALCPLIDDYRIICSA